MKQGLKNTRAARTPVAEVKSSLIPERTPLAHSLSKVCAQAPAFQDWPANGWTLSDRVRHAFLLPSLELKFESGKNLLPVHQFDFRGVVAATMRAANNVLTSSTLERHLNPETQTRLEDLWRMFHEERGPAPGSEKLPERFLLEKEVAPMIFNPLRRSFLLETWELEQDLKAAGMIP